MPARTMKKYHTLASRDARQRIWEGPTWRIARRNSRGKLGPVPPAWFAGREAQWEMRPSKWSSGDWLVCNVGDEIVVFAPPGVGLLEDATSEAAVNWRVATWNSADEFAVDELPDNQTVHGSLVDVAERVPAEHHEWMIEQTREHVERLRRAARMIAKGKSQDVRRRIAGLLQTALEEAADIEQLRSSVLRSNGDGPAREPDRPRAEVAALLRIVADDVREGQSPDLLIEEIEQLRGRTENLLRDHHYVRNSKSWAWTRMLRFIRRPHWRHPDDPLSSMPH